MKSPITKAFENFSGEYLRLNSATIEQHKVIDSIKVCKTERLGFNVQACEDCGSIIKHYNSCSNPVRTGPQLSGHKQRQVAFGKTKRPVAGKIPPYCFYCPSRIAPTV